MVLCGRGEFEAVVSWLPCGSGFNADSLVAPGTVIVILASALLLAATCGAVHPPGRLQYKVRVLSKLGALLP